MAEYVYTTVPGKIKTFLAKITTVGVPPKVTGQWLKTVGFTSSNDASLIGVLKFIWFVDASGGPTEKWSQFRGSSGKKVLGEAIRQGYAELYGIYPDAHQRPRGELESVFSTSTKGGRDVISKLVSTFKTLAEEAEFEPRQTPNGDLQVPGGPLHAAPAPAGPAPSSSRATSSPSLHIDVQIHISPEAGPDQIEQIFASMAKHLYGASKS